jgi:hypothetical protein
METPMEHSANISAFENQQANTTSATDRSSQEPVFNADQELVNVDDFLEYHFSYGMPGDGERLLEEFDANVKSMMDLIERCLENLREMQALTGEPWGFDVSNLENTLWKADNAIKSGIVEADYQAT